MLPFGLGRLRALDCAIFARENLGSGEFRAGMRRNRPGQRPFAGFTSRKDGCNKLPSQAPNSASESGKAQAAQRGEETMQGEPSSRGEADLAERPPVGAAKSRTTTPPTTMPPGGMPPTDVRNPDYFHKVVDCQWACPAHTPVPEYIRLIAAGRYSDAYMVNWTSNVFPGILGRTCDRPCEPACRRGRVEKEPVAICRLKRVAADFKDDDDIRSRLPKPVARRNGKRIALVGGGPASLAVARDL